MNKIILFLIGLLCGAVGLYSVSLALPEKKMVGLPSVGNVAADPTDRSESKPKVVAPRELIGNTAPVLSGDVSVIAGIFSGLEQGNYKELLDRLPSLKNSTYQNPLKRILLNEWAAADFFGALSYARGDRSGGQWESRERLGIILQHAGVERFQAAMKWLEENIKDYRDRGYLQTQIYKGMAADNPFSAIDLASQQPAGLSRETAVKAVVEEWASTDPQAVLQWIESQPAGSSSLQLYAVAMRIYSKQQPGSAAELVLQMDASSLKSELAGSLVSCLAEKDVDAALEWVQRLGDETACARGLSRLLDTWVINNPKSALNFVLDLDVDAFSLPKRDDVDAQLVYLQQVTGQIAAGNPQALAERLPDIPDVMQPIIAGQLARSWFVQNPEAAWKWINTLPVDSPVWESSVRAGIESYLPRDPAMTFSLASVFEDKLQRFHCMQQSVHRWAAFAPDAARKAIQENTVLDLHEKELLLKTVSEIDPLNMIIPGS